MYDDDKDSDELVGWEKGLWVQVVKESLKKGGNIQVAVNEANLAVDAFRKKFPEETLGDGE